jgi:hypothetical protein
MVAKLGYIETSTEPGNQGKTLSPKLLRRCGQVMPAAFLEGQQKAFTDETEAGASMLIPERGTKLCKCCWYSGAVPEYPSRKSVLKGGDDGRTALGAYGHHTQAEASRQFLLREKFCPGCFCCRSCLLKDIPC